MMEMAQYARVHNMAELRCSEERVGRAQSDGIVYFDLGRCIEATFFGDSLS